MVYLLSLSMTDPITACIILHSNSCTRTCINLGSLYGNGGVRNVHGGFSCSRTPLLCPLLHISDIHLIIYLWEINTQNGVYFFQIKVYSLATHFSFTFTHIHVHMYRSSIPQKSHQCWSSPLRPSSQQSQG